MAEEEDRPLDRDGTADQDAIPDFEPIAQHYRLLPHERVVARRYFEHRYSTPELRHSATTVKYGPVALVLIGASYAWGLPGWILTICGLGLLFGSGGAPYAYWVGFAGITMLVIAALRGSPQTAARRKYQAERSGQGRPLPPPPVSPQLDPSPADPPEDGHTR